MSSPFIVIDEISQKLNELNSSISSTLSTINTNVNTINRDVGTANTNINTANTNINAIKTATAASTTANSSGTLSQKLSWIGNSLIGATNNTGGTNTAGTAMAKLNIIIAKLFDVTSNTQFSYAQITDDTGVTNYTLGTVSNKPITKITVSATRKGSTTYPDSNSGSVKINVSGGITAEGSLSWNDSSTSSKSAVIYELTNAVPANKTITIKLTASTYGYNTTYINNIIVTVQTMP